MSLTKEDKVALFKTMLTSRHADLREQRLIRQGKGWFHVSAMGHEAMAVLGLHLEPDDYCFPFYRDRTFVLSRGVKNYDLALAFYAKKDSSSGGRQLPAHYSDRKLNIWSVISPIAAQMLPACGAAWGLKMDSKKNVVFVSVGEGGTRQGDFYESVCFAKEKNLPMIFVVEDNGFAISTKTDSFHALAIKALPKDDWVKIDGCDTIAVYNATKKAVDNARKGKGPQFLWLQMERLSSHSSADDHRTYRTEQEIEEIHTRDPVKQFRIHLIQEGILTEKQADDLDQEIEASVKDDYLKAENAADPKPGDEKKEVFGPLGKGTAPTFSVGKEYRMADALTLSFKDALKMHPEVCFFGEDVEDPLGGVFRLTKGLSTEFPGRVVNSPLAESTIIGVAAGIAGYGKKPVFEIQFIDFIAPAWNQLVNSLANLRWRTNGQWKCPAIIYAPCGGYLPGGALWHSQTMESALAHFPGLLVVMPSTPEDAAGLFNSALACEDPVIFLIPKHMLWVSKKITDKVEAVPLGKAAVRREGSDITIVSWGNCLEVVEEALNKFSGVGVELIDLRTIVPWDKETILNSVKKTGRLVVVQEDSETCSVGQMIISALMENHQVWEALIAPPILVSKGDMHIGFNPVLEYSVLPDVERVVNAVRRTMAISHSREMVKRGGIQLPPQATPPQEVALATGGTKHIIKLPNLGEGLREARVVEIFKKQGESVSQDDSLCEVETDKAIFPVESSFSGFVGKWHVNIGDVIHVGQEMMEIENAKGAIATAANAEPAEFAMQSRITEAGALSQEILRQIEGVLPASLSVVAQWEHLRDARGQVRGRSSGGVFSYTTMVAWSVVQAMKNHPAFCRLLRQGNISDPQKDFDVGFAVALEDDRLETAVISKANTLSWPEFVHEYREGLRKVREGIPQSKARTSLLITSMGPLKMRTGKPIVVPPAIATLFLGEPYFELVADNKSKEVVSLDFCFDHRWANGAGAGRFLKEIKENIENFDEKVLN